ncbi:MAG: hypothetical protein KBF93_10130 [Leptospiraceae bacterium]|nr:hypothetical protein [Leptospiraceae bacterium]
MKKVNLKSKTIILLASLSLVLLSCAGDNDNSEKNDVDSNSDSNSRAISPQKEYTKDKPAEWEGIANEHLPEVKFDKSKTKDNIKVEVLGRKFTERHYIEVIGIMDERQADLDVKYLKRGDKPTVILSLNTKENDPEKIKVFVKCNLHDLWTTPLIAPVE